PRGTTELAVVVEDPDAPNGTFVHWVVVGIDPGTTSMEPETPPPGAEVLPGSSDNATYVGPCPPDGSGTHRYFFEVYALPRRPELPEGAAPLEKVRTIREAASAGGWLVGTFTR
ncbi:MAG: YbhB/YbcL family Raf kinase inhibitor-like protein, partial [Actinomycetota bacterium]|nr:YbhB/YbcL family Raf kinase inhibitor-like protein [Actinomycetota bacterium]